MPMSKKQAIHWLAPASATGALIAALLSTVGHHLFYQSLHGTPVSENAFFGLEISQQQTNIAIGTALAFLAKTCLVVAISIAFVQLFWYATIARRTAAAPTLDRVDALYSTLDNAFEMFNIRSWCYQPLLMMMAGLTWLVPIASVLTPATLSVETAKILPAPTLLTRVPSLDFRSLNFIAPMPHTELPSVVGYHDPTPWFYSYSGPSDAVLRAANTVTVDGTIMPISPSGVNASWQVAFPGPSLECMEVNRTAVMQFGDDFNALLHEQFSHRQYGYIAWFPNGATKDDEDINLPVQANLTRKNITKLDFGSLVPPPTYETLNRSTNTMEMYIMTKPFQLSDLLSFQNDDNTGLRMLRCNLFNATYHVSFDYSAGAQNISINATKSASEGNIQSIPGVLYKVQNQQTDYYEYPCRGDVDHELPCCYNNPKLLQTLSYQAVMDAFTQKLKGPIYLDTTKDQVSMAFRTDSELMQTKLSRAKDIAFLGEAQSPLNVSHASTFQSEVRANKSEVTLNANESRVDFSGAYTDDGERSEAGLDLKDAIEEMFKNFTVSLMGSAALQPNTSSPTAPLPVDVAYHRYHNIYVYSGRKLWLAYGIVLAVATLAVTAGLITMYLNQASYSNTFSTMLRAAHGAELSTRVLDEDAFGQDPLPKYLADARVRLRHRKTGAGGKGSLRGDVSASNAPNSGSTSKGPRSTVRLLGGSSSHPSA